MSSSVNEKLAQMRAAGKYSMREKGNAGELAALDVVHAYRAKHGGLLRQGFMYPYASNRQGKVYLGNIFWDAEHSAFTDVTRQLVDEIDILYISNFSIIPIEVKAYHDKRISIDDKWMSRRGVKVDKSPITQAEKHARHLYHSIYEVIPDGDPAYIKPVVCFVDNCEIEDTRSQKMQEYLPVTILNGLGALLSHIDIPAYYTLDLEVIEKKLKEIEKVGG